MTIKCELCGKEIKEIKVIEVDEESLLRCVLLHEKCYDMILDGKKCFDPYAV